MPAPNSNVSIQPQACHNPCGGLLVPTNPTNPFKLTFKAAVNWFRKRLAIPSKDWKTVQGEENNWAFAISSVQNAEMLADFKAALDRYISEGSDFNQFSKDFKEISERYG